MDRMRVKGKVIALVFVCLISGVFVSGCSMTHNAHHDYKVAMRLSGEALVIGLTDNPEYQQLLVGRPQTYGIRSGRVYLQPGETIGQHITKGNEEMLIFLSGKGVALIGEKETAFEVGQGKVCYIPPNTIHNIKNTSTEPLVYIYCVAPCR